MVATYYAIPCPERLKQNFDTLIHKLDHRVSEPLSPLLVEVANDYTDLIVQVMVLGNSQLMPPDSISRRVLEGVASVIRGTAHTMNKQILHKMTNAEMAPVAAQIRARKLVVGEAEYISFPIPDDLASTYRRCFSAVQAGDLSVRHDFTQAVARFSSLAHQHFYVESMRSLKMGMIARKLVDLGGSAIEKASLAAVHKLVPALNEEELRVFVDYLQPLFIDVT